jgi:hypothetical protein
LIGGTEVFMLCSSLQNNPSFTEIMTSPAKYSLPCPPLVVSFLNFIIKSSEAFVAEKILDDKTYKKYHSLIDNTLDYSTVLEDFDDWIVHNNKLSQISEILTTTRRAAEGITALEEQNGEPVSAFGFQLWGYVAKLKARKYVKLTEECIDEAKLYIAHPRINGMFCLYLLSRLLESCTHVCIGRESRKIGFLQLKNPPLDDEGIFVMDNVI